MKKKLSLQNIAVSSFITEIKLDKLIGASGCCLHDSEPGGNCYTYGHEGGCGSTGNTDDPTGGRNMDTIILCSQSQDPTCP